MRPNWLHQVIKERRLRNILLVLKSLVVFLKVFLGAFVSGEQHVMADNHIYSINNQRVSK
jgi:hypothetical protein